MRLWHNCRGIAAVEFALIAPMLFLLTIGIIDVGRMMWSASTIEHATREGARFAMVRGGSTNQAEIAAVVAGQAVGMNPANLSVSVNWSPDSARGSVVTVAAEYQYNSLLVGFIGVDPITFQSSSSLTILSSM